MHMPQHVFQKAPLSLLNNPRPHRIVSLVAKHIADQAEDPQLGMNPDRIATMPQEAQVVYWLWVFQCEAGVCGIDVFILNSLGMYAPQIHAALRAVGAKDLVRLLEASVAIARNLETAEFTRLADQSWFDQFPPTSQFSSLDSMNPEAFRLIKALPDLVVSYVRAHRDVLFDP
jgi:hypothetical protein